MSQSCLRLVGSGWSCPTPGLTVEALPVKPQLCPSQAPVMPQSSPHVPGDSLSGQRLCGSGKSGPTLGLKSKHSKSSPSQARVMTQSCPSQAPVMCQANVGPCSFQSPSTFNSDPNPTSPHLCIAPVKPQSCPSQARMSQATHCHANACVGRGSLSRHLG